MIKSNGNVGGKHAQEARLRAENEGDAGLMRSQLRTTIPTYTEDHVHDERRLTALLGFP